MHHENLAYAITLTIIAGLSTGIGSLVAFLAKKTNKRFLALALGFSAGVMIYVSMIEIFSEAKTALLKTVGAPRGSWYAAIAFFLGMLVVALIDKLVPECENPHEAMEYSDFEGDKQQIEDKKLHRMGVLSALAIAIHNFPEGLVTFIAALQNPKLGMGIAIAVAIHNIPEGIAVSVPIYFSTGCRKKAFIYSFLSGVSEPLGALFGYFFFLKYLNEAYLWMIFASVAGMMVFISLDQLLPTAKKYGEHHLCIYGVVSGMIVMALSILLLES